MARTNIIIGQPLVDPWEILAFDKKDWEENEQSQTLYTDSRWLPTIMKESGIVKSANEVRRNRPELCISLDKPDFIEIKWGKKFLFILVGE